MTVFPHVYGQMEGENVESFKEVGRGEKGWGAALEAERRAGWLQE
jgi:hypothetical protein